MTLTLRKRHHPLSSPEAQREHLQTLGYDFEDRLDQAKLSPLRARGVEILQLNLGRRCNQTCQHCHVDAGPDRPEIMSDAAGRGRNPQTRHHRGSSRDAPPFPRTGGQRE